MGDLTGGWAEALDDDGLGSMTVNGRWCATDGHHTTTVRQAEAQAQAHSVPSASLQA